MALAATPETSPADRPEAVAPLTQRPLSALDARWSELVLRLGFIATGVALMHLAFLAWQGRLDAHHLIVWLVFLEYALAFGMLIAGMLSFPWLRRLVPAIAASLLLGFVVWAYVTIHINQRFYGTDNIAFSHVAAERLMDGQNPYDVNSRTVVEDAARRFGLPRTFITTTSDGQPLTRLMSWPAGNILPLVPALAVGVNDVRWVAVLFEIATFALLWFRAPPALRPLAAVPLMLDPDLFLAFTGGGVMDYLWVAPMLASVILLYDRRDGWCALLFGLAAGIKQQPWLLAPFLLVWIWNAHRDEPRGRQAYALAEFGALASLGFLALNLPFMVWDFRAWLAGVVLPFHAQLVAYGSGISLLTQTGIVALPKGFYTVSTFGVWGVLWLVYALHFRSLKHTLWIAPAIVMWFAYRSLQNYFIYWTPMVLVALFAWWDEQVHAPPTPPATEEALPT